MNGTWTKENFEQHHKKNPHIYDAFEKYALKAAKRKSRYSAKAIFHIMRWETEIEELDSDYKISDGWISHYARMFMENNPEHKGLFKTAVRKNSYHLE